MPERFDISYIDSNNEKSRPVMIHRTIFGSMERFMGILIEHYAGRFPAWLAPVQTKILPISDKFADYAKEVEARLKEADIRVETDLRDEKVGYKIREAQLNQIPYMLVIGEKEVSEGSVSVRSRDTGEQVSMSLDDFVANLTAEIKEKK